MELIKKLSVGFAALPRKDQKVRSGFALCAARDAPVEIPSKEGTIE